MKLFGRDINNGVIKMDKTDYKQGDLANELKNF